MADPFTLTAVGSVVLTEGIKFLYAQAGDVIKRWRDRQNNATKSEPVLVQAPDVLQGQISSPGIEFDRVEQLEPQIRSLRQTLSDYADGVETVDPSNNELLTRVDALRRLLEAVYEQSISFQGEARPPSGTPVVVGIADVKTVAGTAIGVDVGTVTGGARVEGKLVAERVEQGGEGIATRVDRVGG